MAWTTLCQLDELTEGAGKYVEIDGYELAVFIEGETPRVIDNWCPHAGGSLSAGVVEDGCVVCPWHGWPFRLSDGEYAHLPGFAVKVYAARVLPPKDDGPAWVQADLPMP